MLRLLRWCTRVSVRPLQKRDVVCDSAVKSFPAIEDEDVDEDGADDSIEVGDDAMDGDDDEHRRRCCGGRGWFQVKNYCLRDYTTAAAAAAAAACANKLTIW